MSVTFTKIATPQEKLSWLLGAVNKAYLAGKKVFIFVEDLKVAQFVDNFLWDHPKDSFLPHSIEDESSEKQVVVSWVNSNLNQADHLVNLSKKTLDGKGFLSIDELDLDPKLTESKKEVYAALGYKFN